MSNNFCRFLSNGYKINALDGRLLWSPCCYYTKKTNMLNEKELSNAMEYARSATDWLPECHSCYLVENANSDVLTPRKSSFNRVPGDYPDGVCVDLEVSFDTQCNAACLSCNGASSSTWRKFERKHKLFPYTPEFTDRSDEFFRKLIEHVDLTQVQFVTIQGGEPFFSDSHYKLLTHLSEVHKNLDQVTLTYSTNGSIFPPEEVREIWKKFKRVIISFSIDGIGHRFDYLRWPLNWDEVVRVIHQFIDETDVWFAFNYTMSPLNVLYWDEVSQWISDTIPSTRIFGGQVKLPNRAFGVMDLNAITDEYREFARTLYGDAHGITTMLLNTEYADRITALKAYLDKIDKLRGLDWKQAFPDAVRFLDPPVV